MCAPSYSGPLPILHRSQAYTKGMSQFGLGQSKMFTQLPGAISRRHLATSRTGRSRMAQHRGRRSFRARPSNRSELPKFFYFGETCSAINSARTSSFRRIFFELLDMLLLPVPFRPFPLQRQSSILEQLLLPTVKQNERQTRRSADFRNWDVFNQMSAQQFDLLLCAPMSAFFLQESRSNILIAKRSNHFRPFPHFSDERPRLRFLSVMPLL